MSVSQRSHNRKKAHLGGTRTGSKLDKGIALTTTESQKREMDVRRTEVI
ncbi:MULTISPECIES: hypothetical protein [Cyanophyceae]|nr:hypothetical protein [Trichocoleus sp. FACHB-40]